LAAPELSGGIERYIIKTFLFLASRTNFTEPIFQKRPLLFGRLQGVPTVIEPEDERDEKSDDLIYRSSGSIWPGLLSAAGGGSSSLSEAHDLARNLLPRLLKSKI
jgi:hypothetical protein